MLICLVGYKEDKMKNSRNLLSDQICTPKDIYVHLSFTKR